MNLIYGYRAFPDLFCEVPRFPAIIKRLAVTSIKLFMPILVSSLFLFACVSGLKTEHLSSNIKTGTITAVTPQAQSMQFHRDCGDGMLSVAGSCQRIEEALAASGGRVFWVAQQNPNASDTNPGTRDWPWRTIGRAARELLPGDAVIVREGIYRETIYPPRGGTDANHRITYAAYTGEQVVVSGADVLIDWKQDGDAWRHTWTVSLPPHESNPLDTDPVRLRREMLIVDGVSLSAVGSRDALVPGTFFVEGPGGSPTAIYVRLPNDALPAQHTIEASQRELLFGVLNSSGYCSTGGTPGWLRVIGFTFRHAATPPRASAICPGPEGSLLEENNVVWNTGSGINFSGRNHTLRGNRANDNGRGGMTGGCAGCVLEYNQTLRNNWKGFSPFWSAGGIEKMYQSSNTTIRSHESGDNNGVGIWLDIDNANNVIENSIVYGNLVAGILLEYQTTKTMIRNNVLYGNRIIGSNGPGAGLFVQAASDNMIVHNTFIANEGSGIFIRYDGRALNGNNQIINNILANNGTKCTTGTCHDRGVELYLGGGDAVNARSNKLNGNLYWHLKGESPTFYFAPGCEWLPGCHTETNDLLQWRELVGGEADSRVADPLLEDATQLNGWHLTASSPAIKLGVAPPVSIAIDLDGDMRPQTGADVGADQFKILTPTPTPTPTNQPPTALAGGPYSSTTGQAMQFDGSSSYDPDGGITAFTWDFGDGESATGVSPSHTYEAAGTYAVTLKVTDTGGATAHVTTIALISASVTPPTPTINLSAASPHKSQVALFWSDNLDGESFFQVERSTSASGSFEQIATVNSNLAEYRDLSAARRTTYYYRVCAVRSGEILACSNTASVYVR